MATAPRVFNNHDRYIANKIFSGLARYVPGYQRHLKFIHSLHIRGLVPFGGIWDGLHISNIAHGFITQNFVVIINLGINFGLSFSPRHCDFFGVM